MAKKEEKKQGAEVVSLESATTENIIDVLGKGNIVKDGMMEDIEKKIQEEQDKNIQSRIKVRMLDSKYNEALSLLKMRKSRRDEEIKLRELTQRGNLRRQLCGAIIDETFVSHNKLDNSKKEFDVELYSKDNKQKLVFQKTHVKVGEKIPAIDYLTYDEAYEDIQKRLRKEQDESDEQYAKEKKSLDAYFGSDWRSDWRYRTF